MSGLVMKFGGSSVATTDKIKKIAQLILKRRSEHEELVVVVSAMGDTTDTLLSMAGQVAERPDSREVDLLLSSGELVSVSLLAMHLISLGHPANSFTGFQAGFRTLGKHRKSKIEDIDVSEVMKALASGKIAVVAGFQGMNQSGEITTLGRGGSDTSAVALAAKLNFPCEIYTDVAGIYTADPRLRPQAKKLDRVTYEEAAEMAYLGAKVMDARSVELAQKYHVPLYVALNTGDVQGTYIGSTEDFLMKENMEELRLSNISKIDDVLLVNIENLDRLDKRITECFVALAGAGINVDIINQMLVENKYSAVSFTANMEDEAEIVKILHRLQLDFTLNENLNKVSIIGSAMRHQAGVAAQAFRIFAAQGVPFYVVSTSDISITYVIDSEYTKRIVNALADAFGL